MKAPLVILIAIMVFILGFLVVYSQQQDMTVNAGQTPGAAGAAGGYGAKAAGGYGAKPTAGGYGAPKAGGYGAKPAVGGYGVPKAAGYGMPKAGGYGVPARPAGGK